MINKIFSDSEEKYVMGEVVYFNSTDSLLYYNKVVGDSTTYSNKVSKADLINLFKKGILVVDDGTNFVRPTVLTVATAYASVSHTTVGASDKAVATTFYSNGYTVAAG